MWNYINIYVLISVPYVVESIIPNWIYSCFNFSPHGNQSSTGFIWIYIRIIQNDDIIKESF